MRKLTIHLIPNVFARKMLKRYWKDVECIELREAINIDINKGVKNVIVDLTTKKEFEELHINDFTDEVILLGSDIIDSESGKLNVYTCVIFVKIPKALMYLAKKFDMELIYERPTIMKDRNIVYTITGKEKALQKFLKLVKLFGSVEKSIYKKADFKGYSILNQLTVKQKNILGIAKAAGYYDYPKKISSSELARRMNISKSTLIEHLRKAEFKIMDSLF